MSFISEQLESKIGRRKLLQLSGIASATLLGGSLLAGCGGNDDNDKGSSRSATDAAVLNFALNLEYLEAEYYLYATTGAGLTAADTGAATGPTTVKPGGVTPLPSGTNIGQYAAEIAQDELNHVRFLRRELGGAAVPKPAINLYESFNAAYAAATGNTSATFDPFADELNFLIGAFIFEDVGVTAYRGGSTLISNKDFLSAAAGILGVEAYHAGAIRAILASRSNDTINATGNPTVLNAVIAISDLRDLVDNNGGNKYSNGAGFSTGATGQDDDQPLRDGGLFNLVPTDTNSLAYSRTTAQVLPIVYLGSSPVQTPTPNSFFPNGMNGSIK